MESRRLLIVVLAIGVTLGAAAAAVGETEVPAMVEVELWSLLTGNRAEILDGQVDDFNGSQNGVTVTVVHQGGYSPTKEKITAAASAGNLPPIIMLDYLEVPFYAQNGVVVALDEYITAEDREDFLPGLMADLIVDGATYALPYNRSTQGLYVNNDLLEMAGLSNAPMTWDEFRAQAEAVKSLGDEYYYGYSYFHQWFFDAIMYGWGNELSTPGGDITFNDSSGVAMMSFFQELQNDGYLLIPPTTTGGFEEQKGAFVEGRVATIFESTSWLTTMSDVVDFDWDFAFIPAGAGGHAVTIGGGNFAISRDASPDERDAAAVFLRYITDAEQSAEFHMGTGYMPTRQSVLDIPRVAEFHAEHPEYLVSVDQVEFARPASTSTRNVQSVWWRTTQAIQRILLNSESPQAVLNELAAEFQTELDELKSDGTLIN